jgi:hypothetical protein
MAVRLANNSKMIRYGTRKETEFVFTEDHMFGLEVINTDFGSHYLYINIEANIEDSPLKQFIDEGFIIQVPEDDNFDKQNAMETDQDVDLSEPIMLQYQVRRGEYADIEGGYYKYRFHRTLMDYRYNEKGKRVPENEDLLNENDCLNFGECSTGKYMGLEKENIQMFPYRYGTSILEEKETGMPFGVSDEDNINILKSVPPTKMDIYAIPEPGECYAIVRREFRPAFMYHIAFCIYKDDDINITLEACADHGREYMPLFQFYDRNPNGVNFYTKLKNDYPLSNVIVLRGRDPHAILSEIKEEINEIPLETIDSMEIGGKRKTPNKKSKKQIKRKLKNKTRQKRSKRKSLRKV